MRTDVSRRDVLRAVGVGGAAAGTGAFVPTTATARRGKREGELPNGNVDFTTVTPSGCVEGDGPECELQEVPAGDWILHTVGWIAQGADQECHEDEAEHEAALQNFLEKTQTRAWLDGEEIPDAHQYWSEPRPAKRTGVDFPLLVVWEYFTPPKAPGSNHLFEIEMTWQEETWVGWEEDCSERYRSPGDGGPMSGGYTITKPHDE